MISEEQQKRAELSRYVDNMLGKIPCEYIMDKIFTKFVNDEINFDTFYGLTMIMKNYLRRFEK